MKDFTCLTGAGQTVTFPSRALPEQDRWTVKNAENGPVEWAFDSVRRGGRVSTTSTPDGRIIATAFGDNTVSCRESSTGAEIFRYTGEAAPRTLAFSGDGRTLVAASESGVVELRSLATGSRIVLPLSEATRKNGSLHLAFSPDGTRVATTEWAIPGGPRLSPSGT